MILKRYRRLIGTVASALTLSAVMQAITGAPMLDAKDTTYVLPLLRALLALSNNGDFVRMDSIKQVVALRRGQLTPFEQSYFEYVVCNTDAVCMPATSTMPGPGRASRAARRR